MGGAGVVIYRALIGTIPSATPTYFRWREVNPSVPQRAATSRLTLHGGATLSGDAVPLTC